MSPALSIKERLMKRTLLLAVAFVMPAIMLSMAMPAFAVTRSECVRNVVTQLDPVPQRGYYIPMRYLLGRG
jgi:hypothetical protein